MLIYIEYPKGDKLLHGKRKLTRDELTSITELSPSAGRC